MIDNNGAKRNTKAEYREKINKMGKKEFTLLKMQEYGFWPKNLPTPYEKQLNETPEQYAHRQALSKEYKKVIDEIVKLYDDKDEINRKIRELKDEYKDVGDLEKVRLEIAQRIMKESIERRAEKKRQKELIKQQRSEAWQKKKAEQILYIGNGYSSQLQDNVCDDGKLLLNGLSVIRTDRELSEFLGIEYSELRFLVYHRDVVSADHYHRYTIPKKKGGMRNIAAPKPILKTAQRTILEGILSKITVSGEAHGFLKGKSVVSGAETHIKQPALVINMDIEDFFPTITFERVRGMFKEMGYSGYIASLLSMLCTYSERTGIEVRGKIKYVATTGRILPQGSPASPMITNIICRKMDKRLKGLAGRFGFVYTRYADDMSFSTNNAENGNEGKFCGLVSKILKEEGFNINKAKTRFLRKNNRQSVTGIVINNLEPGVSRKWLKNFRAAVYNAGRLNSTGNIPVEKKNEIAGMAAWLKSVNANRYRDLINAAIEAIK